jgi:hypothetical protein
MAKGLIKINSSTVPTQVTLTTTVTTTTTSATAGSSYNGTTPIGSIVSGTVTDVSSNQTFPFVQPYGAELGLFDGAKVNYTAVSVNGVMTANNVVLVERGVIQTINQTNDGGTLLDKASNTSLPFAHPYCKESQLVVGSVVTFERVIDPNTAINTATALQFIK